MDSQQSFNLTIFTDDTKKVCICSASSIIIIILFIITPLSNFFRTSFFMKIISLIILIYTLYLNNKQTNLLRNINTERSSKEVNSQINMNIICSYVFSVFILLLFIFVFKSFF
jgi:hypothetical protein